MSKVIIIFVIFSLLVPIKLWAEQLQYQLPETLEEIKGAGTRVIKLLPEILKEIWQRVLEFFKKLWSWLKKIWNSYIYPFFHNIWLRVETFLLGEIEKRKSTIKEEFRKEKEEMKEEIKTKLPKTGESLWERFKGLIK